MTDKIPKWALRTTLFFSLPISAGALYLTRTYGIDNLSALNLDASTIFVRRLSIDVLLAAHVAAFFIIALLPDSVFKFRRWQLRILALAIWAFDGTMIFSARLGIMQAADNVQVSAAARIIDQRAAIKGLQESAAAMRATAARQMSNKMITAGALSQKEAARLEAKAAEMSDKLASMPSGSGVTEIKTIGWFAPYKAAIESALVSFVSLIMLGLAGLSARMLLDARERPAPADTPATSKQGVPAPAPPQPQKVSYSIKALRGLGILTAGSAAAVTAPVAHSAPVAPAKPSAPSPAPACTPVDTDALMSTAAPASAPAAPVQVHPYAPVRMQKVQKNPGEVQAATLAKRTPKIAAPAPDARPKELLLTEVLVGAIRAGDKNGGCKPSQRSIRDFLKCNQDNADWYLAGLHKLNVIEPNPSGRGWKVKA